MVFIQLFTNEYLEIYDLIISNFYFKIFIILSLINVIGSLSFIFIGTKFATVKNLFQKHDIDENLEPKSFTEAWTLYLSAPLNSGNGICMWRIWASVPLAISSAIFYEYFIYLMIAITQIYLFLFITDALDGVIARLLDNVTNIGKSLDPLADKFLDLPILLIVSIYSYNPLFIFLTLFIILFDVLGQILRGKNKDTAASWVGKSKTIIKVITIVIMSFSIFDLYLTYNAGLLLIITFILTFWSFYGKLSPKMRSDSIRFLRTYLYMNYDFIKIILKRKKA